MKNHKMNTNSQTKQAISREVREIDKKLSQRFIALDTSGYFLIKLERSAMEIVVEHYTNDIDELGRATDPDTGELLGCSSGEKRSPSKVYRGRTAKEVGIHLTEGEGPYPLSKIDHALYLGRELQRAEACLLSGSPYVQD